MKALTPIFVFRLGGSEYGIDAERLVEVKEGISITPLPFSHPAILGVGNLRGEVIPIVDLGKILHGVPSKGPFYIIVEWKREKVGMKVDEVFKIEYPEEYKVTKQKGMIEEMLGKYIMGVVRIREERFVSVLDIDKILEDVRGGT